MRIFYLFLCLLFIGKGYSQYCSYAATNTGDEDILGVQFSTINNNTVCGSLAGTQGTASGTAALYSDFSNSSVPVPIINPGQTYPLTVKLGCFAGNNNESAWVYYDWNNDNDFADAGELFTIVVSGTTTIAGTNFTTNITVPLNVKIGVRTRMRVVMIYGATTASATGCGSFTWGEVEDYTVFLGKKSFDNSISSIINPDTLGFCGTDVFIPSVMVKNVGNQPTTGGTVAVKFTGQRTNTQKSVSTSYNSVIDAGKDQIVNFTKGIQLTTDEVYLMEVIVKNDSDIIATNDTFREYIQVFQSPKFKMTRDSICMGDSVTISIKSDTLYSPITRIVWPNQSEKDSTKLLILTRSNISVRVERGKCRLDTMITISPYALPSFTIPNDTTLCRGDTFEMNTKVQNLIKIDRIFKVTSSNKTTPVFMLINGESDYVFKDKVIDTLEKTVVITVRNEAIKCESTKSVTVKWENKPIYQKTQDTVCAGNTGRLEIIDSLKIKDARTYISLKWDNGELSNYIMIPTLNYSDSNKIDSIVRLVDMDYKGCKWKDTLKLTINPNPKGTLSISQPIICEGTNDTLNLTKEDSYSTKFKWLNDNDTLDTTKYIKPIENTTYHVNLKNKFGCEKTLSTSVKISSLKDLRVFSSKINNIVCLGEGITLYANGASKYKWLHSSATDSILKLLPADISSSKTFFVEGVSSLGCKDTAQVRVNAKTSNFTAKITVKNDSVICRGDLVEFQAIPDPIGAGYTYDFGALNADPKKTLNLSKSTMPEGTTLYPVVITNQDGCEKEFFASVKVASPPKASYTGITICQGAPSQAISVSEGYNYIWENGLTSSSINVSPSVSRTYKVTVTDANLTSTNPNCQLVLEVPVKVIPKTDVSISSIDTAYICPTAPLSLIARPAGGNFEFSAGANFIEKNKLLIQNLPNNVYSLKYTYIEPINNCSQETVRNFRIKCTSGIDEQNQMANSIQIYPNPFENQINVSFDLNSNGEFEATIYNMLGQKIISKTTKVIQGQNDMYLETESLPSGSYMMDLQINGESFHREKLIKH